MDKEDEEASKLTNPQVEDDQMTVIATESTTTTITVTDSSEAVLEKTEPQCEPESAVGLSKSQPQPNEQQLGGRKDTEEDEIVRKSEDVALAKVSESELGGGGDESRDPEPVVTLVVGEENAAVSSADDVLNAGDSMVCGGEGDEEDVIGEEERDIENPENDVAGEEEEEKAELSQKVVAGVEMDGVDAAEKKLIADGEKGHDVARVVDQETEVKEIVGDDVTVETLTENEREVDDETEAKEIVHEQKGDDVAVEIPTENETKVDDVAEEKEIGGKQKGEDVAVEPQIEYETMVNSMAEETGVLDDLTEERDGIVQNRDIVDNVNMVEMAEEMEIVDKVKAVHVAVETNEKAEMAKDSEYPSEMKIINVADDKEMTKEIEVAKLEDETMSAEDMKDLTEINGAAATADMEVVDVTEETEAQEEETGFIDLAGGEKGVEEKMEKAAMEIEIVEATETDEMEMGDVGEETMEAVADINVESEKVEMADEMEIGEDVDEVSKMAAGKRKRVGKKDSKSPGKAPSRKKSEDVCFICFDGGELVLCDRRGCPKAYHPSCVNRDEAFFRAKGRWNCGWHLCSICEKNAYYMCYTCTFSLCKGCTKDAVILCVRGNKGFCETCMRTVMLIERNELGNKEMAQVDFDDKSSWEYLFKDYWLDLKGRLSLSSDDVARAKKPSKRSDTHAGKQDSLDKVYDANVDRGHGSDTSSENVEAPVTRKRKAKKHSKSHVKDGDSPGRAKLSGEGPSTGGNVEWASKELLELVMHMRKGDNSVLSQFDVQTLLLEYIKKYKLRDPQRRTHVICDARLRNLFGKPRVGHFEMLKLLESHFLVKEDSRVDGVQGSVVDTEANQLETDENSEVLLKGVKDKRRKTRKKGDHKGLQSNIDDYAAIDMHNINLIYLRRNLVEELLGDTETFHDKVVGTFARIRISGSVQKQDMYRLVQVTGTSKGTEPYKVGKRTTNFLLEILNLSKTEVISIDIISNQEFSEDECKRLRQSIKCGLINRLTVGDIQEKAMALQEVRVKDWMEAEILRLSHLRDRASDLGRRKELRECVEKLQLLKSSEERQRRLEEISQIHSDPKMDPSYESEEDDGENDDKRQENYMRPRGNSFSRRGRDPISPGKGSSLLNDSLSGARNYSDGSKELTRNMSSKGFSNKADDFVGGGEIVSESLWTHARDKETQQLDSWDGSGTASNLENGARSPHSVVLSESISKAVSGNSPASASTGLIPSPAQSNESEKIWHYQDPSAKVQGPFSMVQLRKWSNTGYFPANLRIWRSNEKLDDSILLSDALAGKLYKDPPLLDISLPQTISAGKLHVASLQHGMEAQVGGNSNFDRTRSANQYGTLGSSGLSVGGNWKLQPEVNSTGEASLELIKQIKDGWRSETNLPSPTPTQNNVVDIRGKAFEKDWSPTSSNYSGSGSVTMNNVFPGGNGGRQSPTTGQLAHFSTPSSASKFNIDGLNVTHGVTSASKPESGEPHRVQVSPHQLLSSDSVVTPVDPAIDIQNLGASLQTLVQSVSTHITPVESHGWGSGLAARPDMMMTPKPGSGFQGWGNASSQKLEPNNPVSVPAHSPAYAQPYALAFNPGNSPGIFPTSGQPGMPASDSWRSSVTNQSNIQPPAQPIAPWGMGVTGNQNTVARQGPEHQNTGWGQMPGNPSMGWVGQVPASTDMNWAAPAQGQAPGNAHSGWVGPAQGQTHKNAVPGWAPPGQGPSLVNANPGWVAPGQGPPPGNGNPVWGAATGNLGMWGSEENNGGDRFGGQRDRGSQGGDSGYGGGRPWNRQPSFGGRGGDPSRPQLNKGQRVCKFHESGHCKKGSQCDYLHT